MDHRIVAAGVETYGTLTPWSEITSITLMHEPAMIQNEITIAQSYRLILVELVTGEFIEIPDNSPSGNRVMEDLSNHRELRVVDFDDVIAAGGTGKTLLWRPGLQR